MLRSTKKWSLAKEPSFGGVDNFSTPTFNPNGSFNRNVDYLIAKNGENSGRPRLDYIVAMDMAKELCMVSNTRN